MAAAKRAQLVGVLNETASVTERMAASGLFDLQARSVIERMIQVQGDTISFDHIFIMTGTLRLLAAQIVWLIPRQKRN